MKADSTGVLCLWRTHSSERKHWDCERILWCSCDRILLDQSGFSRNLWEQRGWERSSGTEADLNTSSGWSYDHKHWDGLDWNYFAETQLEIIQITQTCFIRYKNTSWHLCSVNGLTIKQLQQVFWSNQIDKKTILACVRLTFNQSWQASPPDEPSVQKNERNFWLFPSTSPLLSKLWEIPALSIRTLFIKPLFSLFCMIKIKNGNCCFFVVLSFLHLTSQARSRHQFYMTAVQIRVGPHGEPQPWLAVTVRDTSRGTGLGRSARRKIALWSDGSNFSGFSSVCLLKYLCFTWM